eukprot:TRINITY_DN2460_c0_g1_i1.p1 TRINITY_DN2460_c0_g1~~TRINITY_DN2460_c0_g1_i1.p1  ORF type:complete len:373 (-),score=115.71 TRINITY_DN2460_c0_g1_i1:84-1067(-)
MSEIVGGEQKQELRTLYPPIEPYSTGRLRVSDLHEVYYEECGNPQGNPVVFLHGGPGGGINAFYRQFFDPQAYRIVLLDQRGAGQSTPFAELRDNNTWALVEDVEKLRKHLSIDRWVVFGGSWGSTLALAYAETHPEVVKALVLRGIFTLRRSELLFFYQDGASWLFPDEFEKYLAVIPAVERFDMMSAYHRRLTGDNEEEKIKSARAWSRWEMATSRLYMDPSLLDKAEDDRFALAFARIECHYFVNGGFFESDSQLIDQATKIAHIPGVIVQGRYDLVCPMKSAWELHKNWPNSELKVIADAGHLDEEPGIIHELILATDKYRNL